MPRRLPSLAAALALVLVLGACGGDSGSGEAAESPTNPEAAEPMEAELHFVATDIAWKGAPTTATAGQVAFAIENQGQIIHNLKVEGLPVSLEVAPGAKETQSIDLKPGIYTFFCDVPGHREAGMEGTLAVS